MRQFSISACALICACLLFYPGCNRPSPYHNDPIPQHDELKIESKVIGETRIINVFVPPSYSSGDTKYPVLYMPDGGTKEDFPHIANTLASMIEDSKIAPLILVGIENTNRKRDLTGNTDVKEDKELLPDFGGSPNFRDFLRNELRPVIEERYRCNGETAIVGCLLYTSPSPRD